MLQPAFEPRDAALTRLQEIGELQQQRFERCEQRFVMPTFSIRESLRPKPDRVHKVQGVPRMIQVRDTLLPLISLAQVFGIRDAIAEGHDPARIVVVCGAYHAPVLTAEEPAMTDAEKAALPRATGRGPSNGTCGPTSPRW